MNDFIAKVILVALQRKYAQWKANKKAQEAQEDE